MSRVSRQTLDQKLTQKLTPRQVQRLRIFQASRQELEQVLWEELSQNPWLEEVGNGRLAHVEELDAATEPIASEEDWNELYQRETGGKHSHAGLPPDSKTPAEEAVWNPTGLLEQLQSLDLNDKEFRIAEHIVTSLNEAGYFRPAYEDEKGGEPGFVPPERVAEHTAIHIADSDGEEVKPEEVEATLLKIQTTLVPPGVAARTLQEALIRKLERHPANDPLRDKALIILREHFAPFSDRKYEKLMSATEVSHEDLRDIYALVKRIRPYPGISTDSIQELHLGTRGSPAPYVKPDFEVTPDLEVIPCNSWQPRLRLSEVHDESLAQLKREKEEWKAKLDRLEGTLDKLSEEADEKGRLKKKMQRVRQTYDQKKKSYGKLKQQKTRATALLRDLGQRQPTRERVVTAIVSFQAKFFREGPDALRRMTREDIAATMKDLFDGVAMSEETVRRVTHSCYVDTRYGLFKLADLFSRGRVEIEGRKNPSTHVVRRKLRQLIEAEDEPLSDSKLADLLKEQGVRVSRRTVAKYRKQLGFPTSRLRKKI